MEIKMEYNKEIIKTAIKLIQKFRQAKNDDNGIIAKQADKIFDGDRDSAADDIVSSFATCSEFVWDELQDEAILFIQAVLNAEIAGYYVQDNGVYKTREEYADAHIKAVKDYYAKLDDTMQNFIDEVNTEMKKGTDKTDA